MPDAFLTFLNQHQLTTRRALLAVSGGLDSVVLAHRYHRAGLTFGIAHGNFGLRGAESDADEAFVHQLANDYGVPFFCEKFKTESVTKTQGLSIQMAARKLRYAWFDDLLDTQPFEYLATAHHRDDALETLILNLTRGAGLAGLASIRGWQGRVARPLLTQSRAELEGYARANALPWREDRSNATDAYPRNFVRHHVVSLLRQLNPNLSATVGQSLEQLAAARRLLEYHTDALRKAAWRTEGDAQVLDLDPLRQTPEPLLMLHELLRPLGFRYHQSAAIWAGAGGPAGRTFLAPRYSLTLDRARLVILPRQDIGQETAAAVFFIENTPGDVETVHFQLCFGVLSESDAPLGPPTPDMAHLDADQLQFPLTLRRWKPGDWFCPTGMNGQRKKISDFLIDQKVPRPLKNRVWVLLSGEAIAWVVGYRVDERFRVTEATRRVWRGTMARYF